MRWQFFHKIYPPLNFNFVQDNVIKSQIWFNLGLLADTKLTPPFVQIGPHCRASNTWVGNFFIKQTYFKFWNFVRKVDKFSNWSNLGWLADPHFQNSPQNGALNTWADNFFSEPPFNLNFFVGNCSKVLKYGLQHGAKIQELAFFH